MGEMRARRASPRKPIMHEKDEAKSKIFHLRQKTTARIIHKRECRLWKWIWTWNKNGRNGTTGSLTILGSQQGTVDQNR